MSHLGKHRNRKLYTGAKENLEITRTQQYIDSNLVPVQIGVQPKSMDKSKHGKDARITSSEKVKDDDRRKCCNCREAGHAKSQSRTRLKNLANAEWKPVTAKTRPGSTATTGSECVKHTSAIPTCETCLMTDTCAGGGICPRGSDRTAQRDTTESVTAPDDSAHVIVDETHS